MIEHLGQERLAGLVAVEGTPRLLNDSDWAHGVAEVGEGVRMRSALRDEWPSASETLVMDIFGRSGADPAQDELLMELRRVDPDSVARLFWDHLNQDWRDMLATIRVRTLVVAGSASRIGDSVGAAEYLAAAIPDARLAVFEDAGHALFRERSDRFNSVLREFVRACVDHRR